MKKYIFCVILILAVGLVVNAQTGRFFRFADSPTVYKEYTSPEEFFRDGGAKDWSNVEILSSEPILGSVGVTSEYYSTTTSPTINGLTLLKNGNGTFGSVIVTRGGAAGGTFNFYDATTSNRFLRTKAATTTLASFNSDVALGTYTFDVIFTAGLLFQSSSAIGTTTPTWR